MRGHIDVAKLLVERGASILDETLAGGGQTAIDMLLQYGHTDMVREFVGPESAFTLELLAAQGVRNTELNRMYNVLKSSPLIVMRRASIDTDVTSLFSGSESLASANDSISVGKPSS
jgi:ankyrin repeat protein